MLLRFRLRSSALGRSLRPGGSIAGCVSPVEEPPLLRWIAGGGIRLKGTAAGAKNAGKKPIAAASAKEKLTATKVQALEWDGESVLCDCGKPAVLKMSKVKNPGLRYLCCAESVPWFLFIKLDAAQKSKQRCKFFSWIDQPAEEEKKAPSGKKSKAATSGASSGGKAQAKEKPEGASNAGKAKTSRAVKKPGPDEPVAAAKKATVKKALPVKDQVSSKTVATKPPAGANKKKAAATKQEDKAAVANAPAAEKTVKEAAKRKTKTVAPSPPEKNEAAGGAENVGAAVKKTRSKKNAGVSDAIQGAQKNDSATDGAATKNTRSKKNAGLSDAIQGEKKSGSAPDGSGAIPKV
ncbi:hypothetical protein SELMODRAFT_402959 [Selaginella moellendorffii]|uniref:Uncharacterized protein n=1 Tax=Selaginella moellendorffii TaxID=88036 RepID=D8QNL0_SELML|nr:nucleolar and coiled-body phosphoprotein 1 [Selaginella moellendorffii]EFJ38122.1 hypothetical protein SELMODRAFT_402959 [Selaginella moellendorffii]|eukprot:XP_002960583.1 nucleolar and coiled-body phosphoprotein 1 [Selaginella moellendorffii]